MLLNISKIKALWEKLLHQEASPNQIASGFAIGLFVSLLPIIPFQTAVTLLLAYLLRANKVACLVGLHIHIIFIPFVPFIFLAEYYIGTDILNFRHPRYLDPEHINPFHFTLPHNLTHNSWRYLYATLVGALILGTPISLLSFLIVRQAAARWKKTRINLKTGSISISNDSDIKK